MQICTQVGEECAHARGVAVIRLPRPWQRSYGGRGAARRTRGWRASRARWSPWSSPTRCPVAGRQPAMYDAPACVRAKRLGHSTGTHHALRGLRTGTRSGARRLAGTLGRVGAGKPLAKRIGESGIAMMGDVVPGGHLQSDRAVQRPEIPTLHPHEVTTTRRPRCSVRARRSCPRS